MQTFAADRGVDIPAADAKPNRQLMWLIAISVFLHLAALWVLNLGFSVPPVNQPNQEPIQAQIIYFDPVPEQPQPEPATEPVVEIPLPVEAEPQAEPEPVAEIVETEVAEPLPEAQLPQDIPVAENTAPREVTNLPPLNTRDMARRHLQAFQQQQQQQLAEQAVSQYRRQQTSPVLPKRTIDPFVTEEEKLIESTIVDVDCSSTVNKSIAMLSGIVGGTMRCSKGADVSPYIERRLNKGVDPKLKAPTDP